MIGSVDKFGSCKLAWDLQTERFYSPDGTQHCLPCEECGLPQWVGLLTVSTLCDRCALGITEEID